MNNGTTIGSLAQLVQSVCLTSRGSGVRLPQLPPKKDLFRIPEEVFFYVYVPPECYGKSWGKSKTASKSMCYKRQGKNQIADFGNVQNLQFAFFPLSSHIISIECKR